MDKEEADYLRDRDLMLKQRAQGVTMGEEKKGYLREGRDDIIPRRTNFVSRSVITPNMKKDESLIEDGNELSCGPVSRLVPNKESKLSMESIERIEKNLKFAKNSFGLLDEIVNILEHEVAETSITYRLAGSAIQTEIKILPRVLKNGFKWSVYNNLEDLRPVNENSLVLRAKSEGLMNYLALDFFKLWRKFTVKCAHNADVVGNHLKFYKENRESFKAMIDELEAILKRNTTTNESTENMNMF